MELDLDCNNEADEENQSSSNSKPATSLPTSQMACVVMIQICEAVNINVLFPFVAFMVEDMGHSGSELGLYAGGLAASFCAAQLCSAIMWGKFSDEYGRKPAILIGTIGAAVGTLIFGFSKVYSQAVMGRVVSGFLCGNLGVLKSYLAEITDDTNRGKGFSLISLAWSVGCSIAPFAGGALSKPADHYPQYFSKHGLFGQFPYLLPCLLCVFFNIFASIFCAVYMVESRVVSGGRDVVMVGAGSVEMTTTSAVKFSILGDEDEDEEDETQKNSEFEPGVGTEEEEKASLGESDQKKLTMLQRIVAVSTPNSQRKGNYSKLSVTEDGNGDLTDTETVGESTSLDTMANNPAGTAEKAGRLGSGLRLSDLAGGSVDEDDESDVVREKSSSRCACGFCCWSKSPAAKSGGESVLCERVVLLCTSNYGLLAMAYILINETIPLFLKLDTRLGGFSMDSSDIGTLLSLSGFSMLAFTYFLLPIFASQNPLWLFKVGTIVAIPVSFGWPIVAILNEKVLASLPSQAHHIAMWSLLVLVALGQNIGGCLSFTAVMIQINHSVVADDLGKAAEFSFIHFDAHPDLSIPSEGSCVSDWKDKDRLFDALRTEGGISEFIIPLVTNGFIGNVKWIRSPWSYQFADDEKVNIHIFDAICDETGKKKPFTSYVCSPYYIDDGCAMSESELLSQLSPSSGNCFTFPFNVGTCDSLRSKLQQTTICAGPGSINWILDICLDYFSTSNPFRSEIIQSLKEDLSLEDDSILVSYWEIIMNAYQYMRFRGHDGSRNIREWRKRSLATFNSRTLIRESTNDEAFLALYSEEHMAMGRAYVDLMGRLCDATRQLIVQAGSMLLLPHHRSNSEEIAALMVGMEGYLGDLLLLNGPPRLVTIAKSAEDGYTPPQQVEELCTAVLAMLCRVFSLESEQHGIFPAKTTTTQSSSSTRRMLCIHDLSSEDAFSDAYPSLLRAKMRWESRLPGREGPSSSMLGTKRKAELLREHGIDIG
eukprot:gene23858-32247_t